MRRLALSIMTLMIVSGLALAGCMVGSPEQIHTYAYGLSTQTGEAIQATRNAQEQLHLEGTISAKRTQGAAQYEIDVIVARAGGTRDAIESGIISAQTTGTAQANEVTQTVQAGLATSVWPLTATPLKATAESIGRQVQSAVAYDDLQRQWIMPLQALLPTVLGYVTLCLALLGCVYLFLKALPGLVLKLTAIRPTEHGMPMVSQRIGKKLVLHTQDQNMGPGAVIDESGVKPTGMVDDLAAQERTTARKLLVDLVRALPRDRRDRDVAQRLIMAQPATQQPRPVKVEVIDAHSSSDADNWISEVERKLLQDGGGE